MSRIKSRRERTDPTGIAPVQRSALPSRFRRLRLASPLACAGVVLALVPASAAHAATRYVAPGGAGSSCSATAPCSLSQGVTGTAGDDVELAPGDYAVTKTVRVIGSPTIAGAPGQPRPRLIGDPSLDGDVLQMLGGGTIRHLQIDASGPSGVALHLGTGALGEDLVLTSSASDGAATIVRAHAQTTTLLRDALARCAGCGQGAVVFEDNQNGNGAATAAAVTAVATGGAPAIASTVDDATATLVDVAASGAQDIDPTGDAKIHASYSAFRAGSSSGVADDGGNVGAPVFVDPANGDFHEAAGSPTLDAGLADTRAGSVDLDGDQRVAGSAQDIGAYESASGTAPAAAAGVLGASDPLGGPLTEPTVGGDLRPAGRPVRGRSVAVQASAGIVLVRLPGTRRATPLDGAAQVPLGAVIDTTHGTVRLTSASSAHGSQTGLFSGGAFRVRQTHGPRPVTQLALAGGDFSTCPRAGAARAAAKKGPSRRLWGRDKGGRFTTIGRSTSATVRGTRWLTEDRCAGTRVTVAEGAVSVRDWRHRRNVIVRAGHSLFVPTRPRGAHR